MSMLGTTGYDNLVDLFFQFVYSFRLRDQFRTLLLAKEFVRFAAGGSKDHYGNIFKPGIFFQGQQGLSSIHNRHIDVQQDQAGQGAKFGLAVQKSEGLPSIHFMNKDQMGVDLAGSFLDPNAIILIIFHAEKQFG
jgi:hypothetical protein